MIVEDYLRHENYSMNVFMAEGAAEHYCKWQGVNYEKKRKNAKPYPLYSYYAR